MTLMFLYTWHYRSNLRAAYMRTARKVAIKKRSLGWMLYGYLSQESSSKENEVAPILKLAGLNSFWKKKNTSNVCARSHTTMPHVGE